MCQGMWWDTMEPAYSRPHEAVKTYQSESDMSGTQRPTYATGCALPCALRWRPTQRMWACHAPG